MSLRRVILWSVIAIPLLVVASILTPIAHDTLSNNRHLRRMETAIAELPAPPQTRRLASRSAIGILSGNGNHCDYFAGAIFHSGLPTDTLRQHYEGCTFLNPVSGKREQFKFDALTDGETLDARWLPDRFSQLGAWGLSPAVLPPDGTVFFVSIMRSYAPNHDLRCH